LAIQHPFYCSEFIAIAPPSTPFDEAIEFNLRAQTTLLMRDREFIFHWFKNKKETAKRIAVSDNTTNGIAHTKRGGDFV